MHQSRPKNLNLFTIHFPLPAIISILHRLSGAFLFLLIPFMLWGLESSFYLEGFDRIYAWATTGWVRFITWLIFMPFCFHLVAGIRHLLMDAQVGTTLKSGRLSAQLTLAISIILVILAGFWLW
ncbi:MAG TPA: succinate dehydrogenase, cytochrome b556 subunit [Gammaproteobacteria bacterium]|nr:succinate dehydrogenase, cytochrome b556 subunit [Gammaproteobacteria bacterium]